MQYPTVLGVRSGGSWDEVRELTPNTVSIDFQRRNLLADPVPCPDLVDMAGVPGAAVDLRRVFSGHTEYGQDWLVPLAGGCTLVAGSTGAGKNSVMCYGASDSHQARRGKRGGQRRTGRRRGWGIGPGGLMAR